MKDSNVSALVKKVLRKHRAAKTDNRVLLKEVYRALGRKTLNQIFAADSPSPETITRERRKARG